MRSFRLSWPSLVVLGLGFALLCSGSFVSLYDSGVYVSAAERLVSGVLPYSDFRFVQPPGFLLWLAPAGLVGLVSPFWGLLVAALQSLLVSVLVVELCVRLLPGRNGRVSGWVAALVPAAAFVVVSAKLEPLMLLLWLLVFREFSGRCRPFLLGLFVGLAVDVKLWSVALVLALFVVGWSRGGAWLRRVVAGGVVAALVLVPFVVLSPVGFFRDVVSLQLGRRAMRFESFPLVQRVADLTGWTLGSVVFGVVACCVVAVVVGLFVVSWRSWAPVLRLVFLAWLGVAVELLVAPESYPYYFYVSGVLFSILFAVVFVSVVPAVSGRLLWVGACAVSVVFFALVASAGYPGSESRFAARVPEGCVQFVVPGQSFLLGRPLCASAVVDPYAAGFGRGSHVVDLPSFVRFWESRLSGDSGVVSPSRWSTNLPFRRASFRRWFSRRFRLVFARPGFFVFSRGVLGA